MKEKIKENRVIFKTKNYLIKSPEITSTADSGSLFTLPWNIYPLKKKAGKNEPIGESPDDVSSIASFNFEGNQDCGLVKLTFNFNEISDTGELELIFYYICHWAFSQKDVYSLQTNFPKNKQYQQVFDYLSYKKENIDGTVTFRADYPINTIIFLFIGMVMGLVFGIMFSNIKAGLAFGFVIFGSIGIVKDSNYKRTRNFIEKRD